eukprot:8714548-Lingulodinium_polyedra.AAC.1
MVFIFICFRGSWVASTVAQTGASAKQSVIARASENPRARQRPPAPARCCQRPVKDQRSHLSASVEV